MKTLPHYDLPTVFWVTGSAMLAGLCLATGPMIAEMISVQADVLATCQTLAFGLGSWKILRDARRRLIRGYTARLAPWFTEGIFLRAPSVHSRRAQSWHEGAYKSYSFAWSSTRKGPRVDLAMEGTTWTWIVHVHSGHRLWCEAEDGPSLRYHYEAPPSMWGSPTRMEDLSVEWKAVGSKAVAELAAWMRDYRAYTPAIFIHPGMIRLVLHDIGQPPQELPWPDIEGIMDRLVCLARATRVADEPNSIADSTDIFYRDWLTTGQTYATVLEGVLLGTLVVPLVSFWQACRALLA